MHGVPIGIKELFYQKGYLCTGGCAFLADKPVDEDGLAVTLFRNAGAIMIVRSNCPQSALSLHTNNLIYGETRNPHNFGRSPGGSSGGNSA
mmetsp:Transcript_26853/g.40939  ORF Transcript_26853/g.40939 Transcript_26853/m.40939 type:complete len:91 (+) Transcript_26853:451-723(+)